MDDIYGFKEKQLSRKSNQRNATSNLTQWHWKKWMCIYMLYAQVQQEYSVKHIWINVILLLWNKKIHHCQKIMYTMYSKCLWVFSIPLILRKNNTYIEIVSNEKIVHFYMYKKHRWNRIIIFSRSWTLRRILYFQ